MAVGPATRPLPQDAVFPTCRVTLGVIGIHGGKTTPGTSGTGAGRPNGGTAVTLLAGLRHGLRVQPGGVRTAGTTTTSTRRSTYHSDDGEPTAGITPTPRRSSAPTTRAGDDWPETTHPVRESGAGGPKGPSEKLLIPTFSGDVEGTGDGAELPQADCCLGKDDQAQPGSTCLGPLPEPSRVSLGQF